MASGKHGSIFLLEAIPEDLLATADQIIPMIQMNNPFCLTTDSLR